MPKKKITFAEGYPLASYLTDGTTDDETRCPRCGSDKITLPVTTTSGQQLGVCKNCAANYVVNAPRFAVSCSMWPLADKTEQSRWPVTLVFYHALDAAEIFFTQQVNSGRVGAVAIWDRDEKIKEVNRP